MPQSAVGWSVDTLREHFNTILREMDTRYQQRFEAQQREVQAALTAADRAVTKAEVAAEKRFDSVNEFRGLVADQQRTLMPRIEAEVIISNMSKRVDAFDKSLASLSGESRGIHSGWAYALGAVALITTMLSIYAAFRQGSSVSSASTDPRVVYVPVPAGQSAPTPALVPAPTK